MIFSRRDFLGGLASAAGLRSTGLAQGQPRRGAAPITGPAVPELEPFDEALPAFLKEKRLPGGALAITHESRLVYARGFGYANVARKEPVRPESLFRIASISKPFTATAILRLVEKGKLKLEDRPFTFLKLAPLLPREKTDDRLGRITVRNLLQHTAGWDAKKSFEPYARLWDITQAANLSFPTSRTVIRYMLTKPLDFDPGQRYAYANLGYVTLGRVIEHLTGKTYEKHVQEDVLAPLGIKTMRIARTFPEQRASGEVVYYDPKNRTGTFAVAPGRAVPLPYTSNWGLEAFDASGGWIASVVDLARFVRAFDPGAKQRLLEPETQAVMLERPEGRAGHDGNGKPLRLYYGCGWWVRPSDDLAKVTHWHTGAINGVQGTLSRYRAGYNWAVLFNSYHDDGGDFLGDFETLFYNTIAQVKKWPNRDLFAEFK